ncbi:MAG: hypothetical protein DCC57_02970 [Chloroflexi bacterium]|nr:MAG: hypothetical protein DCC57_02970 [Chloroflexota bacterium]
MHRTSSVVYAVVLISLLAAAVWGGAQAAKPARGQTVPPTPTPSPTLTATRMPAPGPLPTSTPLPTPGGQRPPQLLPPDVNFVPISPPGFGDRQNSWAWAMTWWNGYLYVGTNRAWACLEAASIIRISPLLGEYPPDDPDIACTPAPEDLALQAEIWRWSPDKNLWERVYRSPRDVPIAGGKLVPREVGFRGLSVYTEPDGTEALYVGGVSPRFVWAEAAPPRLLRSTDGVNFAPVPQDPGSVLGDLPYASLRNPISFKGRFFILAGPVQGSGVLMEAKNPAGGNNNFQVVSPPNVSISAVEIYNDYLYLGVRSVADGYGVIRTKATGPLPYTYETVVDQGAFLPDLPNIEVLGMQVFQGRLYVGANGVLVPPVLMGPAEMIRINPDNTWDLVMGDGRETPTGWKYPISGFTAGFGNFYNAHVWRMAEFEDNLFVGTFDSSTVYRNSGEGFRPIDYDNLGFDLFYSPNGRDYFPVTRTGFDDKFNFGVRSLETTPAGLFLGTANYYYGLQVWRLPVGSMANNRFVFLPLMRAAGSGQTQAAAAGTPAAPPAPGRAEALVRGDDVVVAWDAALGAQRYQIWRATPLTTTVEGQTVAAGWREPQTVGETRDLYWVDTGAAGGGYLYSVTAVAPGGAQSSSSNLAPLRRESFDILLQQLDAFAWADGEDAAWSHVRNAVQRGLAGGDLGAAISAVTDLRQSVRQLDQQLLPAWQAEDAAYGLDQLQRRLGLLQSGTLQP